MVISPDTPLYNHSLPRIEAWLREQGCQQDNQELHSWRLQKSNWNAELWLDTEQITVRYVKAGEDGQDILRSFKYSLSRQDIEQAVFAGP
ncbi:DUF3143 domain-containing protein [Brunnivagina elsteri]|uniref:DUF3143 domain-containing protein n=1 Tax=Brunnivagina elsteri CCALA 953 TaxID=987040 RepID=A0A2A2TLW8_9CYAN|nr:DUF3143 domain-containing protein [Calothrix elsteri]PAX58487.1 hypothetical protein CK510_07250 [Calothrix elsteri CCALA 953]